MDAIFESTQQALHVSFMVVSLPARQKNTFRLALIQILESVGELSRRQAEFLEYLHGQPSGTIDFAGLSSDEVRAQCAMVVAAVGDQLPEPERFAVWIRYARGIPARPAKSGTSLNPGVPPSIEWKRGVFGMASLLRTSINLSDRTAIMALIAGHAFPNQRETDFSYANISRECNVPVRTLERAAHQVRQRLRDYEEAGVARLTPLFERDGLVLREESDLQPVD